MLAFLKGVAQVLFFVLISSLMNGLAALLRLPLPGSILGLLLVFLLLQLKLIRLEWIDLGAKWLLAEMLLFFIPPAAGMLEYKSLLLVNGPRMLLVVVCSTVIVMSCTGLFSEHFAKIKERRPS
ncbi:holin-like protein [Paenibacillus sp. UNCCL117]|uniref:CidA/LrgA family holin-like protein n=1 Tax=unclassified Paenibacillus TaxID=185978 RepID=UPI00088A9EE6|nr:MULTISPECIES: CidA/LrgA family holin-like protein [unclassified Paenibacillus]SDD57929.1 holin-like protein [Paenibacillus sp. cl123]SFW51096.1 holin-like protein [Paenibacillus sp. UNCCL117]